MPKHGDRAKRPLLPARQASRPVHARAGKRSHAARLQHLAGLALAATGLAVLAYSWLAPAPGDGIQAEQRLDSEEELRELYDHPSPHFCTLKRAPLVCAHGGDASAAPANTLRAFQAALDAGASCLEVDVSLTRDGHLAVLHDRDLAGLLGVPSSSTIPPVKRQRWWWFGASHPAALPPPPTVGAFTWEQLSQLRWAGRGDRVVQLHSVLDALLPRAASIVLDLKLLDPGGGGDPAEAAIDALAQAVVRVLRSSRCGAACIVWAKFDSLVVAVKDMNPAQRVGLVAMNNSDEGRARGMHRALRMPGVASVVGVHFAMTTPQLAAAVRSQGLQLYAWVADTAANMRTALDAGPDAVVTGRPRQLLEALRRRRAACALRHRS